MNGHRSAYYDNIKGLLIYTVVLGHIMTLGARSGPGGSALWNMIFCFNMPLFLYLTGRMTHQSKQLLEKAALGLLVPYLLFQLLFFAYRNLFLQEGYVMNILEPQFALWYLLTSFWFRSFYPLMRRIRGMFWISLVIALLAGLDSTLESYGSLSRTIAFLPYFVAGFQHRLDVTQPVGWKKKTAAAIALVVVFTVIGFGCEYLEVPRLVFECKGPYSDYTKLWYMGVLWRAGVMACAFVVMKLVLIVMPSRNTFLALIGRNSITVYLFHIFFIETFDELGMFSGSGLAGVCTAVVVSALITVALSFPPLAKGYNRIIQWLGNLLFIHNEKMAS